MLSSLPLSPSVAPVAYGKPASSIRTIRTPLSDPASKRLNVGSPGFRFGMDSNPTGEPPESDPRLFLWQMIEAFGGRDAACRVIAQTSDALQQVIRQFPDSPTTGSPPSDPDDPNRVHPQSVVGKALNSVHWTLTHPIGTVGKLGGLLEAGGQWLKATCGDASATPSSPPSSANPASPVSASPTDDPEGDWQGMGFLAEIVSKTANHYQDFQRGIGILRQLARQELNPYLREAIKLYFKNALGVVPYAATDSPIGLAHRFIGQSTSMGKLAQLARNNPQFPLWLQHFLGPLIHQGRPTRTLTETQAAIDTIFGANRYKVEKRMGVGTVCEAYMVVNQQTQTVQGSHGKPVNLNPGDRLVIKLLKEGINAQKLDIERRALLEIIQAVYSNPDERHYHVTFLNSLYEGWNRELDLFHEAEGAKALADGAERFSVVNIYEVGRLSPEHPVKGLPFDPQNPARGVALVQEFIQGVELERLTDMLRLHRSDPAEYQSRLTQGKAPFRPNDHQSYPWLGDPSPWAKAVPKTFLRAQTEQILLINPKTKTRAVHGDPSGGNVLFNLDADQRLKLTYIDTGLTIMRSPAHVLDSVASLTDLMLGNSHSMAAKLVNSAIALPGGVSPNDTSPLAQQQRTKIIRKVARILDAELFRSANDCTNPQVVHRIMTKAMKETGVVQATGDTAFVKSQLQTLLVYNELSHVTGQRPDTISRETLSDLARGFYRLYPVSGRLALRRLAGSLGHVLRHPILATKTFYKFMRRRPEEPETR